MKLFSALFLAASLAASTMAFAWTDALSMNRHIEQTNFIVGDHCSATLIDVNNRLLLTNNHCVIKYLRTTDREIITDGVVEKKKVEDNIDVPLSQKSYTKHRVVSSASYNATIVFRDPALDLALLQMRADTIPQSISSPLFTGEKVMRGETVFVVGNPMGLDASVTKGIISSTNRFLRVGGVERPYLQVDAGITGGNSGGALYNEFGQLIGVPAAGARGTSIGLAIPYYYIHDFLRAACWGSVFDGMAPSYDECSAPE